VTHCKPFVQLSRGSWAASRIRLPRPVVPAPYTPRIAYTIIRQLRAQPPPLYPSQKLHPPILSRPILPTSPPLLTPNTPHPRQHRRRWWISWDRRKVLAADRMKIYLLLFQDTFGTSPTYTTTWTTRRPPITHKVST